MKNVLIGLNLVSLFILSYIIPKKKGLFLFGDGHKDFAGNSKYLFLYCNKQKRFECHYIVDNFSKVTDHSGHYHFLLNNSIKTFWLILRAEYLFVNGMTGDLSISHFLGRFNVINLWHGAPIKKIMFDDEKSFLVHPKNIIEFFMRTFSLLECKMIHTIIAPSEFCKKKFQSAFKNKNVVTTGYPRDDIFFEKTDELISSVLSKLNVPKASKIILYAPTFRDTESDLSPFSENFLEQLNHFLKEYNYYLIVKKHPFTKNMDIKNYDNIIETGPEFSDIQELLLISDILISDYSSVYFDFMVQKKPVISYLYDLETYLNNNRNTYFNIVDKLPGPFAYTEEELLYVLKNLKILVKDNHYKKTYIGTLNEFNAASDGNSSRKIIELLKKG
ncbi:CDP-glycerol glycerophosphotransferase family protein [Methanococcus sp. CF]